MLQYDIKPEITLNVFGTEVTFLCNTGATRTVIHPDDIPGVEESKDIIWVKSANGKSHPERLSKLLTVTDTRTGVSAACQVVLSCPLCVPVTYWGEISSIC